MSARVVDYPTLAQALLDFSHRTDVSNFQDYFIQFGEFRIYRDVFSKNMGDGVQWMEQTFSGVMDPSTGFVSVPTGYLAMKDSQVTSGTGEVSTLLFKDPQWIYSNYPNRLADGFPKYVARDATNFVFGPFPDSAYGMVGTYYGQSSPLTSTNTTTWMTTFCPELLLASCMLEMQPFLRDADGADMWQGMYDDKIASLLALDRSERLAAGAMASDAE